MVIHQCPVCGEFFNKKSTYVNHSNRKNPCKKKILEITPDTPKITPEKHQKNTICIESKSTDNNINNIKINIDDDYKKYCCESCGQKFSRKFSLDRHLNRRCKIKQNNDKKEQDNKEQNNNNEKIDLILKQNEELKNKIEKLKLKIKNKKNKANINNQNINIGQQNININVVSNIINFNDMNYNNIDKKLFIEPIMDRRLFGKAIILKMIENIYINENLPECQNLVITDKNRGYIKVYNNGKWKTDNINIAKK
jgi:hypothetical protein